MTGIVCDSMRRAALGDVWSGPAVSAEVDRADAEAVELAWRSLAPRPKELLRWVYIRNAAPGFICRRLGIRVWPASVFVLELARAEGQIEAALLQLDRRAQGAKP